MCDQDDSGYCCHRTHYEKVKELYGKIDYIFNQGDHVARLVHDVKRLTEENAELKRKLANSDNAATAASLKIIMRQQEKEIGELQRTALEQQNLNRNTVTILNGKITKLTNELADANEQLKLIKGQSQDEMDRHTKQESLLETEIDRLNSELASAR